MNTLTKVNLAGIAKQFQIQDSLEKITSFGNGHVNDTYSVLCNDGRYVSRYILQRINHSIFKYPLKLMENIVRVTNHVRNKLTNQDVQNSDRRVLTVIPTKDGSNCYHDTEGCYWRMYRHIENVRSWDYLNSEDQAYKAARMFGWFQRMLIDLPGPKLNDVIPNFHNTPKRLKDFMMILDNDPNNRAHSSKNEIQFILDHVEICDRLVELVRNELIPERITHNDTKINNVLFDIDTKKGVCVIDLDTVMPGLSLYDFGDMVRTATCKAAEDEKDLSRIKLDIKFFEKIALGYIQETGSFLTDVEKENLVFTGVLITFEQMIRFLSDYLNGDVYYKIHRPEQNLDRAKTQMKLVHSIFNQEEQMNAITNHICKNLS